MVFGTGSHTVTLPYGLALAPLAGVSDRPFRRVCRHFGAEYTVSEMVSAKALCFEQKIKKSNVRHVSGELASVLPDELPMAVQLFGHEPDFMAEAARLLTSGAYTGNSHGTPAVGSTAVVPTASDPTAAMPPAVDLSAAVPPAAIDINMGCPMPKIVNNGEGSALLRDPVLAGRIVKAVVDATDLPVTVKIRSGWDEDSVNAPEIAKRCEQAGASMICVHARTRKQKYEPGIDLSVIRAVKQAVSVPVMGNGDINTPEDALTMLRETGCDGVMIARGAMGNPWLFTAIRAAMDGKAFTMPSPHERFDVALDQVRCMIAEKGERVGLAEAKKHLAWYCWGMDGACVTRGQIMQSVTLAEMERAVRALADAQDGRMRNLPPRAERRTGEKV